VHDVVSYNGEILIIDSVNIDAVSAAALYGTGVFTTLAIEDRKPFLWDKHWGRLTANGGRLGMDLSGISEPGTRTALEHLIANNDLLRGRARITIFDERSTDIWAGRSRRATGVLIMTADRHQMPSEFRITLSPFAVNSASPLAGVKSCNYLEKILARSEARRRGFDECIQLNERGELASVAMANVFWVKGTSLFTPSLKTGCIAGTTRQFVLENIACQEVETGVEDVQSADEIFLTSAGLGVTQVSEFDGRRLKRGSHPIAGLLPFG
jgi:branched-chain amino acid aminotransferase